MYCDLDGHFPNHHPDPTVVENLADLIHAVTEHKAHVGIGYDGDADRIGVIDEQGEIMWGDRLLLLFARDVLEEHPGSTFISEVKASQVFYDDIPQRGGRAIMWKTGAFHYEGQNERGATSSKLPQLPTSDQPKSTGTTTLLAECSITA